MAENSTPLAATVGTVASRDGTSLVYDRVGDGPPVVLVEGLVFHRGYGIARLLSQVIAQRGFTVFAYDRRAHGESGDGPSYSIDREIEDLEAVIGVAGAPVHLFAASTGAALSLEAANRGLPLRSLALFETPFLVDSSRPPMDEDLAERLTSLIADHRLEDAMSYYVSRHMRIPRLAMPLVRRGKTWKQSVAGAGVLAREVGLFSEFFRGKPLPPGRWDGITVPTIVLAGSKTLDWLKTTARELAGVLPNAGFALVNGQGHMAKPEVLGPVVADFFSTPH